MVMDAQASSVGSSLKRIATTRNISVRRTKVFLTHIIRTSDALYVVGISRGIMDLSIQVTSLDPETGVWINAVEIPASIKSGDDFYPLKIGSTSKVGGLARIAGLAWLEGRPQPISYVTVLTNHV